MAAVSFQHRRQNFSDELCKKHKKFSFTSVVTYSIIFARANKRQCLFTACFRVFVFYRKTEIMNRIYLFCNITFNVRKYNHLFPFGRGEHDEQSKQIKKSVFPGGNIAIRLDEKSMKINRKSHYDTLVGSAKCVFRTTVRFSNNVISELFVYVNSIILNLIKNYRF